VANPVSMSYGSLYLISLFVTIIVEVPVLLFAQKLLRTGLKVKEILYWSVFANLFSLPYLWFVFPLFIPRHNYILTGETLITLIEMIIFSKTLKLNLKKAMALSIIANTISYFAGLAILNWLA
jgi:hypothetical protein